MSGRNATGSNGRGGNGNRNRNTRRGKQVSFRTFVNGRYYAPRNEPYKQLPVDEAEEEGLPFDPRLRIHAPGHPHHKVPNPHRFTRRNQKVRNMMARHRQRYDKFLYYLDTFGEHILAEVRTRLLETYEHLSYPHAQELAVDLYIRYAQHYHESKPDVEHANMIALIEVTPGEDDIDATKFVHAIADEMMEWHLPREENNAPVARHLGQQSGNAWKANQMERGTYGSSLNTRMSARSRLMKELLAKRKRGEALDEEEEAFLRTIATNEV